MEIETSSHWTTLYKSKGKENDCCIIGFGWIFEHGYRSVWITLIGVVFELKI